MLAVTTSLALALAALDGIVLRRTLSVSFGARVEWLDVTPLVANALPALPCAVCHLETAGAERVGVTLLDPRLLSLGSATSIAPGASSQRRLALALVSGALLLPADVRILALRDAGEYFHPAPKGRQRPSRTAPPTPCYGRDCRASGGVWPLCGHLSVAFGCALKCPQMHTD